MSNPSAIPSPEAARLMVASYRRALAEAARRTDTKGGPACRWLRRDVVLQCAMLGVPEPIARAAWEAFESGLPHDAVAAFVWLCAAKNALLSENLRRSRRNLLPA